MSHTPGPWTATNECHDGTGLDIVFKSRNPFSEDPELLATAYECCNWEDKEECRANSRLIAAAPDLLEACKLEVSMHLAPEAYPADHPVAMMLAAIKKAEAP